MKAYGVVLVAGTRMYPPTDLPHGELTMNNGTPRVSTPGPVVYAPGFAAAKRPFVRVSFGVEHRVGEAAERFMHALRRNLRPVGPPTMPYRLLALDVDGTLLDPDGELRDIVRQRSWAAQAGRTAGHPVHRPAFPLGAPMGQKLQLGRPHRGAQRRPS